MCAQTFPELKSQVHSEPDNLKKINLLKEASSELSQFIPSQQAEYWFLLGSSLLKQRKMKEAVLSFTKGIDLYHNNKLPNSSLLVNLHIERSRTAGSVNFSDTAACDDRKQALFIAREIAEQSLIAKSIAYYAKCLQSEQYGISKSLKLFDEAFNIAKNQQLAPTIKGIIYNQAATLSFSALLYDKAYEYNMLSYELFTPTNDISSIYFSILNAVHYSIALVDIELARKHLYELMQFSEKHVKFKGAKIKFNYLSAKVAELEQNWPLSISFLEAGLNEAKNSQNVSYIQATYELLSIAYFRVGEIEKSYQTLAAVEKLYPNKKPIKKELLLIKGVMVGNSAEIAKSAFNLIDKEKTIKKSFC